MILSIGDTMVYEAERHSSSNYATNSAVSHGALHDRFLRMPRPM